MEKEGDESFREYIVLVVIVLGDYAFISCGDMIRAESLVSATRETAFTPSQFRAPA